MDSAAAVDERPYYTGLDGLRGLAILLILGYHNFSFVPVFKHAWLGVDLFFALSGFLITDILLKSRKSENYLRNFYARRVLRIFPLYYLSLFIFFALLPDSMLLPESSGYYDANKHWFWVYLQNWLFIFKTPDPTTFLNHYWSLAVEEQFYIIWPFLLLVVPDTKYLIRLLVTVLVLQLLT